MFGIFQADIPIGYHLWLALLALVIAGSLASTPLAKVNEDPVGFVRDLLLLYGYATLTELGILFVSCIPLVIIDDVDKQLRPRKKFYQETEVQSRLAMRILRFLLPIAFVVAVVLAASSFGDASSRNLGVIGLFLYLCGETIDWQVLRPRGYQYLELKHLGQNILEAQLVTSDSKESFQVKADWMQTLAYLTDNRWELLEVSYQEQPSTKAGSFQHGLLSTTIRATGVLPELPHDEAEAPIPQHQALLRRSYRKSVIPKEWREAFANLITKGLNWLRRSIKAVRNFISDP